MNCFSTNLIEIIGYQIEKVHSGMLAWLVNSKNTQIPIEKKVDLINKITQLSELLINFVLQSFS